MSYEPNCPCYGDPLRLREHENERKPSIMDVRDRLNNILDLLHLCGDSLLYGQHIDVKKQVAHVLYFYVEEQIKQAEKELSNL